MDSLGVFVFPDSGSFSREDSMFPAYVPLLSIRRYAELTGDSPVGVRRQVERGQLPVQRVGARVYINVALIHQQALSAKW